MISLKPESYSFEEAAAFKTAYLTAYVGLLRRGQLQRGETLLVHGASGGVGMAAVQLGKLYGAKVIATGTSDEKLEIVKTWGADEVLNIFENEKVSFKDRVKDLTNGKGADVIYDPVGGEVFDQSIRCINWGGRLLIIGFAGGTIPTLPVNYPLIKGFSVVGVRAGEFGRRDPLLGKENIDIINSLADEDKVRPHICKVFDFKDSKEALEFLENRELIAYFTDLSFFFFHFAVNVPIKLSASLKISFFLSGFILSNDLGRIDSLGLDAKNFLLSLINFQYKPSTTSHQGPFL